MAVRRLVLDIDDATLTDLEIAAAGSGLPRRIALLPGQYAEAMLADAPDVLYLCDELSGAVLNDSSGNGVNGIINSATYGNAGREGSCLTTTGVVMATVAGNARFQPTIDEPWSLEWWQYGYSDDFTGRAIITALQAAAPYNGIQVWSDTNLYAAIVVGNPAASLVAYFTLLGFNAAGWNHLVLLYDGTQVGTGLRLYVNGVQRTPYNVSGSSVAAIDYTGQSLLLGGGPAAAGWNPLLSGSKLDMVAFYKGRELTQGEVISHFEGVLAGSAVWSADLGAATLVREVVVPGDLANRSTLAVVERATTMTLDGSPYPMNVDNGIVPANPFAVRLDLAPAVDGIPHPWVGGPTGEGPVVVYEDSITPTAYAAIPDTDPGDAGIVAPLNTDRPGFVQAVTRTLLITGD